MCNILTKLIAPPSHTIWGNLMFGQKANKKIEIQQLSDTHLTFSLHFSKIREMALKSRDHVKW